MCNGNHGFAGCDGGQWRFHGQDAILAERRAYGFRIDALWQEELTVVLPIDALRVRFLFVLGMHLCGARYKKKNLN